MKRFEDIINEKLNNFEYPFEETAWKQFLRKTRIKKIIRTSIVTATIAGIGSLIFVYFYYINTNKEQITQQIKNENYSAPKNNDSIHIVNINNNISKQTLKKDLTENKTKSNNLQETIQENRLSSKNYETNSTITPENNYQFSISTSSTIGCVPHTVQFIIDNEIPKEAIFYWTFGDGKFSNEKNPTYTYNKPGKYKASLKITLNEIDIFEKELPTIEVNPRPIAKMYYQQTGNIIKLENKSKQYSSIRWEYIDSTIIENTWEFKISKSGTYSVKLIAENQYGCTDTIIKNIDAIYYIPIQIADAFTPDGDGVNDLFGPQVLDYNSYNFTMYIYTKTGKCVFEGKGSPIWWDGTDKDTKQLCPADVYFYKIIATDNLANKQEFSGKIKLLR